MKTLSAVLEKGHKVYDQVVSALLPSSIRWHVESALGITHGLGEGDALADEGKPNSFGRYWPITFLIFTILILYFVAGYFVFLDFPYKLGLFTIGACGFCFLLVFGPKVTFPLYFATFFGTGIPLPGAPLSLNQAMGFAFLASWVIRQFAKQRFSIPTSFPFFLFVSLTFYAIFMNVVMKDAESPVSYQQVIYMLVGLAVFQTYREPKDFLQLIKVLLGITCAISVFGLLEYIFRRDFFPQFSDSTFYAESIRVNGISRNAIQYAFNATWMIPFAVFLHIQSTTAKTRFWSMVLVVYLIACCLITFNRQTPIIISAMMVVGVAFMKYRYRGALIVGMVIVGAILSPFVIGKIAERFAGIGDGGPPDLSIAIRYDKILVAKEILKDHWLMGIGLNNFNDYWFQYRPPGDLYLIHFDPERDYYIDLGYLQMLTDTGVVGFTAFLTLIFSSAVMWFKAFRKSMKFENTFYRNLLAVLSMSFAQLLISMLIQDTFFIPRTYLLFFILFLVLYWVKNYSEDNEAYSFKNKTEV